VSYQYLSVLSTEAQSDDETKDEELRFKQEPQVFKVRYFREFYLDFEPATKETPLRLKVDLSISMGHFIQRNPF